jgi:hypothetical protein
MGVTFPFKEITAAEVDLLTIDLTNMFADLQLLEKVKSFTLRLPQGTKFTNAKGELDVAALKSAIDVQLQSLRRVAELSDEAFTKTYEESTALRAFFQDHANVPMSGESITQVVTTPASFTLLAPEIRELEHTLNALRENIDVLDRVDPVHKETPKAKFLLLRFQNLSNFETKDEFVRSKPELDGAFVRLNFIVDEMQDKHPGEIQYLRQSQMPTERDYLTPTFQEGKLGSMYSKGFWITSASVVALGALVLYVRKHPK